MKRLMLATTAIALLVGSPAHALTITNLDTVTHTVEIDSRGEKRHYVLAPDASENVPGQVGGTMNIVYPEPAKGKTKKVKRKRGSVEADGLLGGVLGSQPSVDVPIDNDFDYVIWPGGKLAVQSRNRARRGL